MSIFHQTSVKFQHPKMQAENDVSPKVKLSSKALSQTQHKQVLNCESLPKIDRETAAQCQKLSQLATVWPSQTQMSPNLNNHMSNLQK